MSATRPDSDDCSLTRLCHSDTALRMGIPNQPDARQTRNLERLSDMLRQVSELLGAPLQITSGFRCDALNAAVGGVPDSQHVMGLAADFKCPQAGSALQVARLVANSDLPFDQLILEYGRWIHLSIAAADDLPRREVLTILDAASGYVDGLPDENDETARA